MMAHGYFSSPAVVIIGLIGKMEMEFTEYYDEQVNENKASTCMARHG